MMMKPTKYIGEKYYGRTNYCMDHKNEKHRKSTFALVKCSQFAVRSAGTANISVAKMIKHILHRFSLSHSPFLSISFLLLLCRFLLVKSIIIYSSVSNPTYKSIKKKKNQRMRVAPTHTHTHLLLHPIPEVSFLVMRANGTQHIRNVHICFFTRHRLANTSYAGSKEAYKQEFLKIQAEDLW